MGVPPWMNRNAEDRTGQGEDVYVDILKKKPKWMLEEEPPPVKHEPVKHEPVKHEPVKHEPVKHEPVKHHGWFTKDEAKEQGRKGGLKGGLIRQAQMTPDERKALARKAAVTRWSKKNG